MASLEDRVAALEARVGIEAEARASMDRHLLEIEQTGRATNLMVQALAITQGQHDAKLTRVEDGVREILAILSGMQGDA